MPDWETCCDNINDFVRRRNVLFSGILLGLILIAFAIRVVQYYHHHPTGDQQSSKYTADYLMLALSWPISFCRLKVKNRTGGGDACNLSKNKNNWIIHGFWPVKKRSKLENCPLSNITKSQFNETELKPIRDQLEEYWPTMLKNWNDSGFWAYEWSKHGTCASQIEPLNTQLKYFQRTLELYSQYNVTKALNDCDIYPDDIKLYKKVEFIDCFKKYFNIRPQLSCDKRRNEMTVIETRFCFHKNFTLLNCDESSSSQKYCNDTFIYPINVEPRA